MPAIAVERGPKELAHGLSLRERIAPDRFMIMERAAKTMTVALRVLFIWVLCYWVRRSSSWVTIRMMAGSSLRRPR